MWEMSESVAADFAAHVIAPDYQEVLSRSELQHFIATLALFLERYWHINFNMIITQITGGFFFKLVQIATCPGVNSSDFRAVKYGSKCNCMLITKDVFFCYLCLFKSIHTYIHTSCHTPQRTHTFFLCTWNEVLLFISACVTINISHLRLKFPLPAHTAAKPALSSLLHFWLCALRWSLAIEYASSMWLISC